MKLGGFVTKIAVALAMRPRLRKAFLSAPKNSFAAKSGSLGKATDRHATAGDVGDPPIATRAYGPGASLAETLPGGWLLPFYPGILEAH